MFEQIRYIMLTDAIEQDGPVLWDKQQPALPEEEQYVPSSKQQKMLLPEEIKPELHSDPRRIESQSTPSASTSGDLGGSAICIIQGDINSQTDNIKMEPDGDFVDYKVEFLDMGAVCKEEAAPNPELESSAAPKPELVEPAPVPVPQKPKIKKQRVRYTESYLEEAVNKVRNGTLSMYAASKLSGIPRTTLQYRLSAGFKNKGTCGPFAVFLPNEEREIVDWIKDMARRGFPTTRSSIEYKVGKYLKVHPRKHPFKDNKPGNTWIKGFIKRNPDVNMKQYLSRNATEQDIGIWFRDVLSYLKDNQLAYILKDPSRILHANEAGFLLNFISNGVVDKSASRSVKLVDINKEDNNVTVLFTFVANGCFVPPKVVLSSKRISQDTQQSFPSMWGLARSDNGAMNVKIFTLYVMKVLYPTLVKHGTKFPVLYFVDRHMYQAAYETADMCKQYGIILIGLYPNASAIIQQSLRTTWDSVFRNFRLKHETKRMTLRIFGDLLKEAMDEAFNESTIPNGFTISGLHPFDSKAIDFKKYYDIFAENTASSNEDVARVAYTSDDEEDAEGDSVGFDIEDESMDIEDASMDRQVEVPVRVLKTALNMLGPSRISLYQTIQADDLSYEDEVLSYMYKNILILGESPAHDATRESANSISTSKEGVFRKSPNLAPDDATVSLEFDVTMDIKTENDSEESTDMIVGSSDNDRESTHHCDKATASVAEEAPNSENCQQNEINSNYAEETSAGAVCFATEHICSFPRITVHVCPVSSKTKYHSFLLDQTGMYITYLNACRKSSHEPVSSQVYHEIVLKERTKDPSLPSRCDDCQHVEKYDFGELSCAFLNN